MKLNNLVVDTDAIGTGLYSIICEKGEEAIVAFGMIPKWVIDLFEKQLRDKILSEAAKQVQCTPEEIAPIVDKTIVQDMVNKITRQVSIAIYAEAKRQGKMIV